MFQIIYKIKGGCISDVDGTQNLTVQQVCDRILREVDINSDGKLTSYLKPKYSQKSKSIKTSFSRILALNNSLETICCLFCRSDHTGGVCGRSSEESVAAELPSSRCQSLWLGPEILV